MVKVKVTNEVQGVLELASTATQERFVGRALQTLNGLLKMSEIIVTEEDYKGAVPAGFLFEDYQMMVLEEILTNELSIEDIAIVAHISETGQIGVGLNMARLEEGFATANKLYVEIEDLVDNMLPLEKEDIERIAPELRLTIGNILYGFLKSMGIYNSIGGIHKGEDIVEINGELYKYLMETGQTVEGFLDAMHKLTKVNRPLLELFEEDPDLWEDMVENAPIEFRSDMYNYADYITGEDAVRFKEGTLIINEFYIETLSSREANQNA